MPSQAKPYIAFVIACGGILVVLAARCWSSANLRQFVIYLCLVAFASALKVRIPGMEGTISPNFVFLLLGIMALPYSQVVAVSVAAALVQSLWASTKRPRFVQVAFSAATVILSSSLAYEFSHLILSESGTESLLVRVILGGSIYFPLNSALVSIVIGLVEGQPLKQVCRRCYAWVFPYFMVGIAFAGLVSGVYAPSAVWKGALVLLPTMVLTYVYFFNRGARPTPAMMVPSSAEEECPAEVSS